jgi:class 3 adenylate cyclase
VSGTAARAPWRSPVTSLITVANLVGAVVTFCYFTFIDLATREDATVGTAANVAFFVVGFAVILAVALWFAARWRAPVLHEGLDVDEPEVRRRALAMPLRMAGVSALGWCLAGLVWGVIWPALTDNLSLARVVRQMIGITVIGGSITTAFTFFAVEQRWRRQLPRYFPRGDLSAVPGVPRLRVRTRLLVIFLLVGVLPLILMATLALNRAHRMLGADRVVGTALLHNMVVAIVFLLGVGLVTAVGLALFVSRSVAAPLRDVERAMERVGRGDLEARAPVVSNDEIGAVAEGFNRMVGGLRERERIRETFGKYVSPEVRDEILAGGVRLHGQRREVTILFSDLRDFTPWVESHPPEEVVRDINAYFTLMEGAIRAHGGLVVQFIGDEIEAVFGAPVAEPRHADLAVAAGFEMCRRLEEWNESRRAAGAVILRHGIGIHTGEVLAASIGSPERLSYALVGDPVNLASRIQGLTKEVGGDLLVSGETVRRLKEPFALEALPAVRVKGRSAEVEVYRAA